MIPQVLTLGLLITLVALIIVFRKVLAVGIKQLFNSVKTLENKLEDKE